MAIQINGNTVIDDNRRGDFSLTNFSSYTEDQLDNLVVRGGAVGDIVYNSSIGDLNFWDGEKWVPQAKAEPGEAVYVNPGTYTWTCPRGVKSVCVVCVGAGGAGGYAWFHLGGFGGGLGWKNNIPVQAGQAYTVVVGRGGIARSNQGAGGDSYFISTNTVMGGGGKGGESRYVQGCALGTSNSCYSRVFLPGGRYVGDGGGVGGGFNYYWCFSHGGGGAGGYTGPGGSFNNNNPGDFGSGGGGGAGQDGGNSSAGEPQGNGGGGVGIYGKGANGVGGGQPGNGMGRGAGGGGSYDYGTGKNGESNRGIPDGGFPGGGAGHDHSGRAPGRGGGGAVRILWGEDRAFPSTNVGRTF